MPIKHLFCAVLTMVLGFAAMSLRAEQVRATSASCDRLVILVRHAEKAATPSEDPALSSVGAARAQSLAKALSKAGVGAIITTEWRRTQATAEPLARALDIAPIVVRSDDAAHVAAVAAAVCSQPAAVVLVVGHSNTVPAIIAELGGPNLPMIAETDYDNLYVLQLSAAPPRLVQSRY